MFELLAAQLPEGPDLPAVQQPDLGIVLSPPTAEAYIVPELRTLADSAPGVVAPRVILVQAAAAVGKTTMARELAATTGNVYWNLGPPFRVGSHFFTGTLVRAFGGRGYAAMESLIAKGAATLILDAADEALAAAGIANYEQAVIDLCQVLQAAGTGRPGAVIFGRPETIELTSIVLSSMGISSSTMEIGFFSEEASRAFVSRRYMALTSAETDIPIGEFTDVVFRRMRTAMRASLDEWGPELESFLGYAPVLGAVAVLASESRNLHADAQRLDRAGEGSQVWDLMAEVILAILEREQTRFADGFEGGDTRRRRLAGQAYSATQQMRMLLTQDLERADVLIGVEASGEEAQELTLAARGRLREHPFLRNTGRQVSGNALLRFSNVAFRDYIGVFGLTSEHQRLRAETASNYADPTLNSSPLLVRLLLASRRSQHGLLAGGPLAAVLDSAATPLSDARQIQLQISEMVGAEGLLEDTDEGVDTESHAAELSVSEGGSHVGTVPLFAVDDGVSLGRQSSNLVVDLPDATLTLGSGQVSVALGPNLVIRAKVVQSEPEEVRVKGLVSLTCQTMRGSTTRVVERGTATRLQLHTAAAPYPWHEFVAQGRPDRPSDSDLLQGGLDLRKVVNWFALSTHQMTLTERTVERLLRKGRLPQRMVDHCREQGVIVLQPPQVAFRPPASLHAIRSVDLSDAALRHFLEQFVAADL